MPSTLDLIELGTAEPEQAREFYVSVLGLPSTQAEAPLDLHGAGTLTFGAELPGEGLAGGLVVVNYIVPQPIEVTYIMDSAVAAGAEILRPGKKGFFGGFAGSFRSPDGSIWKVSSPHKKETVAPFTPPTPTEIVVMLGAADMKASRSFYEAEGFTVDRDYGAKFVDFTFVKPAFRLALIPLKALSKDVGVDPDTNQAEGDPVLLTRQTRQGKDQHFADPDSIRWAAVPADHIDPETQPRKNDHG